MAKIDEKAVSMWEDDLFSLQMIAEYFRCSRQAVKKYLNKRGVDTSKGGVRSVICDKCGKEFKAHRSRLRMRRKHYCSVKCYYDSIDNPDYNGNRQGQIKARRVVKEFFPLSEENVVHHRDGDNENNDPVNLMVFANQSAHMRWHRAGGKESGVIPLWPKLSEDDDKVQRAKKCQEYLDKPKARVIENIRTKMRKTEKEYVGCISGQPVYREKGAT